MLYTKEQVMNGIISYIDNEIMPHMPTLNKIVIGTGMVLAIKNSETILNNAINTYGKILGVVNGEGLIDVDTLADALRENAKKYGSVQINLPMASTITFKSDDIDILRRYII